MNRPRAGAITLATVSLLLMQAGLRPAAGETTGALTGASATKTCDRAAFRVVVDVGHTAEKPGAKSARGFYEYDFNLKLATLIEQKLKEAGFAKTTLLITAGSARPGLVKRVARANGMPADLFLSIHHDSVPDSFLEKWEFEGEERAYSDRFKGHSIFVSRDNADYRASVQFASMLGRQLKERGLKYTPHYTEKFMGNRRRELVDADAGVYRYDQLIVLKSTRMPAVLLEAGSIINRDEELQVATPERRSLTSAAVVSAVDSFCATRTPGAAKPTTTRSMERRQASPAKRR